MANWVFQTGCVAPGFTRNDWGTSRPCLLPPMAVKSKPPALRVVVDSGPPEKIMPSDAKDRKWL
jgi:hypothetical protein